MREVFLSPARSGTRRFTFIVPLTRTVSAARSAELLSQLSGVRRAAGGQINSSGPSALQLQQLQMQLQLERQQAQAARQQVESSRHATRRGNNPGNAGAAVPLPSTATANSAAAGESNQSSVSHNSQFLLAR